MNHDPVEPPAPGDGAPDDGIDPLVVIPDDARELDRDAEAWRREERWLRRRRRLERLFLVGRWRERGVPGLMIAFILLAVALLGATISILTPRPQHGRTAPVQLALATPTASPGAAHGLLPDVELVASDGAQKRSRSLRPGVVAIVPPGCACEAALTNLAGQVTANALPVFVVADPEQASQLAGFAGAVAEDDVHMFTDPSGTLVDTYEPSGLTVVPVHADGVTDDVVRDFTSDRRLGPVLVSLKQPGAR